MYDLEKMVEEHFKSISQEQLLKNLEDLNIDDFIIKEDISFYLLVSHENITLYYDDQKSIYNFNNNINNEFPFDLAS